MVEDVSHSGRLKIPEKLSELDSEWFGTLFETTVLGVASGSAIAGVAVTSTVARLELLSDPPGSAPSSVVAKIVNRRWQAGYDLYQREVNFYRDFVGGQSLPVPRCFHADFDPASGAFVLILEDLSDVRPGHRLEGLTVAEAEAVVDGLADIHLRFWQAESAQSLRVRTHTPSRIADSLASLHQSLASIRQSKRYPVSNELVDAVPRVKENYAAGMLRLSKTPQTLIHSDLHVENFFLEAWLDGFRLIIIDWQNPCFGNAAFDVGSVLSSLRPELQGKRGIALVERYHERLSIASLDLEQLQSDVAAAVRHQFVGSANWFAAPEAQSHRTFKTMQGHWMRLTAALLAIERFDE